MPRTKAMRIYRRTKNLRAVQLLLGHSRLEGTVSSPSTSQANNLARVGEAAQLLPLA